MGAAVTGRRAPIDDRVLAAGPCPSVHRPTVCIGGRRQKRVQFLASAAGAGEGAALAAAPRMTTIDNTEVKCILIVCFLEIFEEGAGLEETDEAGELLMVLRTGSTRLI